MPELREKDIGWNKVFTEFNILKKLNEKSSIEISTKKIKKITEPRLLATANQRSDLAVVFQENHLGLVSDKRGYYLIGKFDTFFDLNHKNNITPISVLLPDKLETFKNSNATTESIQIHKAEASNMIARVMNLKDDEIPIQTLSGRMGSGEFSFKIDNTNRNLPPINVDVSNTQIEIDACFESKDKIMCIEAKSNIYPDFNIRQLYYPYRMLANLKTGKEIINAYLTIKNGIFSFHLFKFNDLENFSSIEFVKQIDFKIDNDK